MDMQRSEIYTSMRAQIMSSFLSSQKVGQDPSESSVCRCLFGRGDPELNKRVAREQLKEHQQQMSKKYNFDFATETPKKGDYEWEKENDVANIPEMYTTVKVKSPRVATPLVTRTILHTSNNTTTSSNAGNCDVSRVSNDVSKTVYSSQDKPSTSMQSTSPHLSQLQPHMTSPRKRQMEITDYFHAKKSRTEMVAKRRLDL